jgi:hypothetical protein
VSLSARTSDAVLPGQPAQQLHLALLAGFHVLKVASVGQGNLLFGKLRTRGLLDVQGEEIAGNQVPVPDLDDAMHGLGWAHQDFDLGNAGGPSQGGGGGLEGLPRGRRGQRQGQGGEGQEEGETHGGNWCHLEKQQGT